MAATHLFANRNFVRYPGQIFSEIFGRYPNCSLSEAFANRDFTVSNFVTTKRRNFSMKSLFEVGSKQNYLHITAIYSVDLKNRGK